MNHNFAPLTLEERRQILGVLDEVIQVIYPELQLPYLQAVGASRNTLEPVDFQGHLPTEVLSTARSHGPDLSDDLAVRTALMRYLYDDPDRNAHVQGLLNSKVRPVLQRCSRINEESFALLWRKFVDADPPSRTLSFLVEHFTPRECGGREGLFVDTFVYDYQVHRLTDGTLTPSERWAVYQVLSLAAANLGVESPETAIRHWLSGVLRIGAYDLVPRLLALAPTVGSEQDKENIAFLVAGALGGQLDGILFFLGDNLLAYLDALESLELRYYQNRPCGASDSLGRVEAIPTLRELRAVPEDGPPSDENGARRYLFGSATVGYAHESFHHYRPTWLLLPVLFYVDSGTYGSPEIARLLALSDRGLAYWRLRDLRHKYCYGDPPFSTEEWERLAYRRLIRRVIALWHTYRDDPPQLLRRCRRLLQSTQSRRWASQINKDNFKGLRTCMTLLPLWLLELRALRLFGRDSRQWRTADRLARERLVSFAYPELIHTYRDGEPGLVLLALEALRQLAVAQGLDPATEDFWEHEPLRCARELLVRLETIPDRMIRRSLSGFLRPILSSIAGSLASKATQSSDALCLFEQARSRWLLDHLALGSGTLVITSTDSEMVCTLRDRLFDVLNPVAGPGEPIVLRSINNDLWRELRQAAPELARQVMASWPDMDHVHALMPPPATVLAYHVEDDPAEPPLIRFDAAATPWPATTPGSNARLWMFQLREGTCRTLLCPASATNVMQQTSRLRSIGLSAQRWQDGQPMLDWQEPGLVARYEDGLSALAVLLVKPWEPSWPTNAFPLLILPCGELFQLPWPALPLHRGGHLLDGTIPGVLPGLGPALWLASDPHRSAPVKRADVFVRRAPFVSGGLILRQQLLDGLRRQPFRLLENKDATPERALDAFRESDCLIFLCHGQGGDQPGLELARTVRFPTGRLTVTELGQMDPVERAQVVILGVCWSGLETRYAAEDVEGLTGILFLKGVRAVLSGIGWVPVELIAAGIEGVMNGLELGQPSANLARQLREAQLRFRGVSMPPACWGVFLFHGVPWGVSTQGDGLRVLHAAND